MIAEIFKDSNHPIKLEYQYLTDASYDVAIDKGDKFWTFHLTLIKLPKTIERRSSSTLFESIVEKPKCFKYVVDGQDMAYLQLGHQTWNNRMRIWDFLVDKENRRRGIGSELMNLAKKEAAKVGARMLILETQSCNVPAIKFYLKHGFQLIGFDLAHYSNQDIARREFRLEFGLAIEMPKKS